MEKTPVNAMDSMVSEMFAGSHERPAEEQPPVALDIYCDHGVLIVRVLERSLLDQAVIGSIRDRIALAAARHQDITAVLVDCSQVVQRISSGFLGMLASLGVPLCDRNLQMGVCGLNSVLMQAIEVTRLDWIVGVYSSLEEGMYEVARFSEEEVLARNYQRARDRFRQTKLDQATRPPRQRLALPAIPRRAYPLFAIAAGLLLMVAWASLPDAPPAVAERPGPHAPVYGLDAQHPSTRILSGVVKFTHGGSRLPDTGAVVIVWRKNDNAPRVKTAQLYACLNGVAQIPGDAVFVARVSDQGKFQLRVPAGANYQLLIVSRHAPAAQPPDASSVEQLAKMFDDPLRLVEDKSFRLCTCAMAAVAERKEIQWCFETPPE